MNYECVYYNYEKTMFNLSKNGTRLHPGTMIVSSNQLSFRCWRELMFNYAAFLSGMWEPSVCGLGHSQKGILYR